MDLQSNRKTNSPIEPKGTDTNTQPDPEELSWKGFLQFLDDQLTSHFGKFLGTENMLGKVIALLSTAFIVYFNYLEHRFNVGYYHDAFGVPEAYLGAAWNSSMSDFVLNALLSIVRCYVILAVLAICCGILRSFYRRNRDKNWFSKLMWLLFWSTLCLVHKWYTSPLRIATDRLILFFLAALAGGVILSLMGYILLDCYHLWQDTMRRRNYCCTHTEDCAHNSEQPCNVWKPPVWFRKRHWICLTLIVIGLILCGCCASFLGRCIAVLQTDITYLCAGEAVCQQLDQSDYDPQKDCWAILYRTGDQYVIAPCQIDGSTATKDSKGEATVYPQYHCVISSDGAVVTSGEFSRIHISGDDLLSKNGWTFKEKIDGMLKTVGFKFSRKPAESTAPDETTEPVPPDETTEPVPPVETTEPAPPVETTEPVPPDEPTEPAPPDETTDTRISYEVTELHISSDITELSISGEITWPVGGCRGGCCDCCRCTPGLG